MLIESIQSESQRVRDICKLFLIIFSLALLFIIGSASAMRYFDAKSVKKKNMYKK